MADRAFLLSHIYVCLQFINLDLFTSMGQFLSYQTSLDAITELSTNTNINSVFVLLHLDPKKRPN